MNRRDAMFAVLASLYARVGVAQPRERLRRLAFVSLRVGPNEYDAAFRESLRALGYIEGQTVRIDYGWAAGSEQEAEKIVASFLARKVEIIVAANTPAVRAAMRATREVPIVMAAVADPLSAGLVASLARPGGNVTGLSLVSSDTAAKRLQLLQEVIPAAQRIAVLIFSSTAEPVNAALIEQLRTAARNLNLELSVHGALKASELAAAFESMRREGAQALIVGANPLSVENRARIAELAATHRLPAMYESEGFVSAGGLLSYGPSLADMYRRAAIYVDKILKGAKPADLPIELPVKYDLEVNLKTAKALGLRFPRSLVVRADRVVE